MPEPGTPGRVRGAERDAQIRATIRPLAPGERPAAVTVAAVLALVFGAGNIILYAAGYGIQGARHGTVASAVVFAALMVVDAAGMWRVRYWAVLGFQVLLGVTAVYAGLALLVASNLRAVVLCVVVLVGAGTLFWHLIRPLARIRTPSSVNGHG
jgi:hypothetical protein